MNETVVFKCRIIRNTYNSDNYKVYAVDVDRNKYPFIKFTKYSSAVIYGDIQLLAEGQDYEITAIEENSKHGYGYKISNIKKDKPSTESELQIFLQEILTYRQASELYNAYPNIVQKIINNETSDIDFSKIKGVNEKTFEKIKEKVVENYCLIELVNMFKGTISISILKHLYEKYTSIKVVKNKLREDAYKCFCGISRVGFKKADVILQDLEKQGIIKFDYPLKTSPQRCLSCVLYLLEENENEGNTKINIKKLKKQCETLTPECSEHFVSAIKNENVYYDKNTLFTSLWSTYEIEEYIANQIKNGLKNNIVWNFDCEKYRTNGDISLTDEQLQALKNLCKYNISILNGSGGCGKSQTTTNIIKMLDDNNKTYKLFSPTGKAAKVLKDYCNRPTSTIHRGLGFLPPNKWSYNEDNKMYCDVLIIDEFSMVDIFICKRVIEAIDFSRTKLLIIGDNAQLPSVSCGNLLHDLITSNVIPATTLTKVFRYGKGGLMTVATDVRNCKPYLNNENKNTIDFYGENKDYGFINCDSNDLIKNVLGLYKKLLLQGDVPSDIQVLTSYNKGDFGTIVLNNHLQKLANKKNYGLTECIKIGEVSYYKDDIVIQKKNNYHATMTNPPITEEWDSKNQETFIPNGETGVIKSINGFSAVIDFDGVEVVYDRGAMTEIGLGYSISIHKCQGSSIKTVILLTPSSHAYMLNSNLIYVGLTRMKERCFHLGDKNTVDRAVKKKENFDRETWLSSLLLQNSQNNT